MLAFINCAGLEPCNISPPVVESVLKMHPRNYDEFAMAFRKRLGPSCSDAYEIPPDFAAVRSSLPKQMDMKAWPHFTNPNDLYKVGPGRQPRYSWMFTATPFSNVIKEGDPICAYFDCDFNLIAWWITCFPKEKAESLLYSGENAYTRYPSPICVRPDY